MEKSMFGWLNVVLELFSAIRVIPIFICMLFSNPHHRPRREKEEGSTFTQQIGIRLATAYCLEINT